jgi:type 1 glutamine amidotransferase
MVTCGLIVLMVMLITGLAQAAAAPRFKVVFLAEESPSDQHYQTVLAAKAWIAKLATDSNFSVTCVVDPKGFTDTYLADYKVIFEFNYPPFNWNTTSVAAFQKYMEQGKGGWVGFHHASLYGSAVGETGWPWFSTFLGGIQYTGYIAALATATVRLEDTLHPCMKGVTKTFSVANDEWYTWSPNPRQNSNVKVLANVDESTYNPNRGSDPKMGSDHPVVWSNQSSTYKGRNVYIFMGHSATCFTNTAYTKLASNSIFWAAATGTDAKEIKRNGQHVNAAMNLIVRRERQSLVLQIPGAERFGITVTNAQGRKVLLQNNILGVCRIARASLSSGVYLIQANCGIGTLYQKLFVE